MNKIAVIGGGAAGIMAATRIMELQGENEVFLIERNNVLGKKVLISGGGRCNLTTGLSDLKEVLQKYPRGARFLRTCLHSFPPTALIEWMEEHGVPLKTEADQRVFPESDNGKDVVDAFQKVLKQSGANIFFETTLKSITKQDKKFVLNFEERETLEVDKVILCAGGQAYRHTGSSGDGYSFAESLGHSITDLGPSLNAFLLAEKWPQNLSGLSFKQVTLTFRGQEKFSFKGGTMFTHKGVTGPGIFALSALAAYENFDQNSPAKLGIDFFPEQNHEQLQQSFYEKLEKNPKKVFSKILKSFIPKSFAEELCAQLEIPTSKLCSEFKKKDLNKIIDALKNLPLTIIGRVAGGEFVTAGGVNLTEVNPKTMESKLCPGLYFGGEILNYDGFTGGFNLQAAWSTGRLAGESAILS
jgi:predicted Rossmann fold flavoprotein